jgi:hypothetical protein
MLVVLSLFIFNALALTALEAEGLVRYGFCTTAAASRDCSWAANCRGVFCASSSPNAGNIAFLNYRPKNTDTIAFRGISSDFTRYFENISTLSVNDTQVSPPVRWSLANLASGLKLINTLIIYSQPGGLYGTLPQRFTSPYIGGLVIDGELEGTIPSGIFGSVYDPQVQLLNHRLVGTIPSSLLLSAGTSVKLQSENGGLVGEIPTSLTCQLSSGYTTGQGQNGGLFCECSTSCVPDQATGVNMCYDYTNPSTTIDPCVTYPSLPNCANTKLTMRYGTLCYDICDAGCPAGTACGIEFNQNVPSFTCLEISINTVTTPTTYPSNESSDSPSYATLTTLLLSVL